MVLITIEPTKIVIYYICRRVFINRNSYNVRRNYLPTKMLALNRLDICQYLCWVPEILAA